MTDKDLLRDTRMAVFENILSGKVFRDENALNTSTPYQGDEHYTRSIAASSERITKLLQIHNAPTEVVQAFADMNPSCFFSDPQGIDEQKGCLKTLFWIENYLEYLRTDK